MPYRRRFHKRSHSRDKYSVEQTIVQTPATLNWTEYPATESNRATRQFAISILPPTDVEGMRKIKHLTFTISNNFNEDAEQTPLVYAIVYVPEGYNPQVLNFPLTGTATKLYSANQFVLSSGILDFSGGPLRIRSPLSRNLNSGDSIHLLLAVPNGVTSPMYTAEIKYAITLQ